MNEGENMKIKRLTIRMTTEEWKHLEKLCEVLKAPQMSEVVRRLIRSQGKLLANEGATT